MRRLALGILLLAVLTLAFVGLVPKRDQPLANWWIRDEAHLLKPAEELRLTRYHGDLLDLSDIDFRIVTNAETYDIDAFAVETFAELGVGGRSASGRGLLLVIDPAAQRVRLEVARELEGTYPDAYVAYIERDQMAPFFAADRVADGILATTELLVARAADPDVGLTEPSGLRAATSVGAGAVAAAPIGAGYERPAAVSPVHAPAGTTPESTVAAYLAAMAVRDARPDLDLYTPATRRFLATHIVTPAQMDNVVRSYATCGTTHVLSQRARAAVTYPQGGAACAPWLIEQSDDGLWRLDLATMSRALRFDTANRWYLADPDAAAQYGFAFSGR